MNDRLAKAEAVFHEALELPPEQREGFLQQACGEDAELLREVAALLRASGIADHWLKDDPSEGERLPGRSHAEAGPREPERPGATISLPITEKAGDRIGRYKLREKVGEGGCGVVYVAEQEEPVRRRVALKVIKLGMDTKSVIARFEAERQALAIMDHPNVAKVLDAGTTETGRPFFVMELVRGIRITDYCDQNNLSTGERLDLFIKVCQAVQHAHQKGIIHRDLKPSNILVTLHDGVPVPKIIDFGIAKATEGRLTNLTVYTELNQFIGTPAYMSPEQAEMSGLDIDTRADIYSLGVLLYELLTGQPPFDPEELLRQGLDEIRRTIREVEPPRPSTRLSTLAAASLGNVAQHRHTEAPKLMSLIRGDLDWIVMKCLEKDRTRRYETANGLAADIQRHLKQEPVVARPPSTAYRFQKLVRRNKLAFAAGGAVAGALLLGLVVSLWLLAAERAARHRAVAAEKNAETEGARSEQVAQFMKDMLKGVGPSVAVGRDTRLLREIVDQTAQRLDKDLKGQPPVEADLRATLGRVYFDVGDYTNAATMHRKAAELRMSLLGAQHRDTANSLNDLGEALRSQGRHSEAEPLIREALRVRKLRLGDEHLEVASSLDSLGMTIYYDKGGGARSAEGEAMVREALGMRRRLLGNEHLDVAASLVHLGLVLDQERTSAGADQARRFAEAEAVHREALGLRRRLLGNDHPAVAESLHVLAWSLFREQKYSDAEAIFREALALRRTLLGTEHPEIITTLLNLGTTLRFEQKYNDAEATFREALDKSRKILGTDNPGVVSPLGSLAAVLERQGKLTEAEARYREALAINTDSYGKWHPPVVDLMGGLARVLCEQGRYAEAEQLFNDALTPALQNQPPSAILLCNRAELFARSGRWREAVADLTKAIALRPQDHEPYHMLAPLLVASGDLESYRKHCRKVIARFRETKYPIVAERMAKDCLILPSSGADPAAVGQMADTAVKLGKSGHPFIPFFQFCKALAEYRQGNFTNAVEWANRSLSKPGLDFRDAQAYTVLSMACYKLNHNNEGRDALAKATEIERTKADLAGSSWGDWIIARCLIQEAEQLSEPKPTP